MNEQEKNLVIKDICGRLPYGVYVKEERDSLDPCPVIYTYDYHPFINVCRPYLRPMESMTEEELKYFHAFHCVDELHPHFFPQMCNLTNETAMFDWLNKNMFDYRGLIPKGLALPARIMEICTKGLVGNYKKSNRYISCNKEGMYNKKEE